MNEYRYMRTILFFDLPVETVKQKKAYRDFVKQLKINGFFRMQKSVFCKMSIDMQNVDSTINRLKSKLPNEGVVMSLTVTEKQFENMVYLLGDYKSELLETDERLVEL